MLLLPSSYVHVAFLNLNYNLVVYALQQMISVLLINTYIYIYSLSGEKNNYLTNNSTLLIMKVKPFLTAKGLPKSNYKGFLLLIILDTSLKKIQGKINRKSKKFSLKFPH